MATSRKLSSVSRKLLKHHGAPAGPASDEPFALILWEQVAYLVNDERRLAAFELLERRVGLAPADILKAGHDVLAEIAASGGGIAADKRATRMQESAERVVSEWDGDLRKALRLPLKEAMRALVKFPMIGRPGAEKVLLLTRAHPVLALDSNALRVLLRLGYGSEDKRYEKSYASVRAATAPQERVDFEWLITLHGLLRRHGQEVCRRTRPECESCPLFHECDYAGA